MFGCVLGCFVRIECVWVCWEGIECVLSVLGRNRECFGGVGKD